LEHLESPKKVFAELLKKPTAERDYQRFLREFPDILSLPLPLALEPEEIVPLGRPGISEPDFIFYSKEFQSKPLYGVIELKRPDSKILRIPRKNIIMLAADAELAVTQGRIYSEELGWKIHQRDEHVLFVGDPRYVFVVMGLSNKLAEKVAADLEQQYSRLLPQGFQLIPYDTLLRWFSATVPPFVTFAFPKYISLRESEVQGDTAEIESVPNSEAKEVEDFFTILRSSHPELWRQLGLEMILYLFVINHKLSETDRKIIDAFTSNDKKIVERTKSDVGAANYDKTVFRLFNGKLFHQIAKKVTQDWLSQGHFKRIKGGNRSELLRIVSLLDEQIGSPPSGKK